MSGQHIIIEQLRADVERLTKLHGRELLERMEAERERDEWKAKHDTLADVSRACIATTERERDALHVALELAEVEVALDRSWCRICRTECRGAHRGRREHMHATECALNIRAPAPSAKPAPAEEAGGRAVTRKRGAWTKDEPYTRKDGTATRGTTIYLPVELAERLRRFAFEQDRKQNAIITEAIEAFLAERGA